MLLITFPCPKCASRLDVPDTAAGRPIKCPACGANAVVPHPVPTEPPASAKSVPKPMPSESSGSPKSLPFRAATPAPRLSSRPALEPEENDDRLEELLVERRAARTRSRLIRLVSAAAVIAILFTATISYLLVKNKRQQRETALANSSVAPLVRNTAPLPRGTPKDASIPSPGNMQDPSVPRGPGMGEPARAEQQPAVIEPKFANEPFDASPESFLRWSASVRRDAMRIRNAKPGNVFAEKEAEEFWSTQMQSVVGRSIRWQVRLESILAGPTAKVEEMLFLETPQFRVVLRVGVPIIPATLRQTPPGRHYNGPLLVDPIGPAMGEKQWLKDASSGSAAILTGIITKASNMESTWIDILNAQGEIKVRGRELEINLAIKDAILSKP